MEEFTNLVETVDKIFHHCGWSCRQTLKSLQPYLLEEVYEVIEAMDRDVDEQIMEELGDLFYILLFCAKIAEKNKRFDLVRTLSKINEKLIRRHPHVFDNVKVHSVEEIAQNWQKIKKKESKGVLSGISENLPSLVRAQKILHRLKTNGFPELKSELLPLHTEEQIANALIHVLMTADSEAIDVEGALRRKLIHLQQQFKEWEGSL
ncbi:MAG: hypothetical protein LBC45_02625 [Chlamydiales bacterium]|jgi:uncharacterized protein YabN with tetrapyrrole methylase and pyrophosphatase domain|nr:hypothetical protein [Chlamydiales bacterium]